MTEVLAGQMVIPQTCKRCDIEIHEGHAYELGDDRWHIHCFKCFKCEKSLGCNSNFLVLGNGSLVCSQCSYSCKQCHKKIDDLAILTGDQAYCSSCFKCRLCKSKIEDLRYARTSKGLFCMSCHEGLIEKKKRHDMKRRQMAQLSSSSRPSPQEELDSPFGEAPTRRSASSYSSKELPLLQPELVARNSSRDDLGDVRDSKRSEAQTRLEARTDTRDAKSDARDARTDTRDAKSDARDARTDTRDAKSDARDARTDTRDAKSDARDAKSDTRNANINTTDTKSEKSDARSDAKDNSEPLPRVRPRASAENRGKGLDIKPGEPSAVSSDNRSSGGTPSAPTSHLSPHSADHLHIEEINDSDDELKMRRMRDKGEGGDRRSQRPPADADGAILELIDSLSAPNTPSTGHNGADELSVGSKTDDRKPSSDASDGVDPEKPNNASRDDLRDAALARSGSTAGSRRSNTSSHPTPRMPDRRESSSPQKNLLLLSPNQFHDHDFHVTERNSLSHSLPADEQIRPRSSASSPVAKANRQARVVETTDVSVSEIPLDIGPELSSAVGGTPQNRGWDAGVLSGGVSTPKKSSNSSNVASPPPRLSLPSVPLTPPQPFTDAAGQSTGLGLDVSMQPASSGTGQNGSSQNAHYASNPDSQGSQSFRRTPAVTNLEDTVSQENPPSRKQSVRSKISLKHKRSISGGQNNLSSKFGLFKAKDEEKGHSRTTSEGSIASSAHITAPLPFSSPMRGAFRDHTRSTSDSQFGGDMSADFEMRSIKFELGQLDQRRQSLLAETGKLTNEKNRLLESLRAVQKKHASEQQRHDALMVQINHLSNERTRLLEENSRLKQSMGSVSNDARHRSNSGGSNSSPGNGSFGGQSTASSTMGPSTLAPSMGSTPSVASTIASTVAPGAGNRISQVYDTDMYESSGGLDSVVEEGSEAKATRLKFWRRPKVTIGVTGQAVANGMPKGNGAPPKANPSQSKLNASASQSQLNAHLNPDESNARKARNFMSKSRSTFVLDNLGDPDTSLFSATLQARAVYENEPVPLIITRCLAEVEARGFDVEGIYRLSGGNSAITAIENAFAAVTSAPDRKQSARLSEVLSGDINAVTSALKRYLRKLPDPIIPFAVYDSFIRIGQARQERGKQDGAKTNDLCGEFTARILDRLPSANKHALYMIGKHLDQVNYYSCVNRMNFKNLSVVFAPTIARDVTGDREMVDMGARNEATELLFCNFKRIFQNYHP